MTEMVDGFNLGDEISSDVITPSLTDENQGANERIFKQSEVNEIIKKAKYGAVEDYKRKSAKIDNSVIPSTKSSVTEEDVRNLASEETKRLREEWIREAESNSQHQEAQRVVKDFWNKLSTGKDTYDDFDDVINDIDYVSFPNVVFLVTDHTDNTSDVMYELGKNRMKMVQLEQMYRMSPKEALKEIKNFSKSLKQKNEASNFKSPNEPLRQLKPSNIGTEAGVSSVNDYRRKYKF